MGMEEMFAVLQAGQDRIERGMERLNEKQDAHGQRLGTLETSIAALGIEPRLKNAEEFKKTWEPRLIIGFFVVGIIGAGIGLLVKAMF